MEMIIFPPEKLAAYISIDDQGNWTHDPCMPEELLKEFHQFVKQEADIRKNLKTMEH